MTDAPSQPSPEPAVPRSSPAFATATPSPHRLAHPRLCFERPAVFLSPSNGMLTLDSVENGAKFHRLVVQPGEIGLFEAKPVCLVVDDADQVHAAAKAARAPNGPRHLRYGTERPRLHLPRPRRPPLWSIGTSDSRSPQELQLPVKNVSAKPCAKLTLRDTFSHGAKSVRQVP